MEQFLLAYDSDLAPVVGQQITLTSANSAAAGPRIDLLIARAAAPFISKSLNGTVTECDLVAQVGAARVGVVHGDATSLAGWGFAAARLDEPQHRRCIARGGGTGPIRLCLMWRARASSLT